MLVVHVPRDACEGTVTGAGACPGEFSQYSEICTEWEGALYSPDGAVCTVTLTMPDGSTRSKQVVVKASDDGCVRYEEVTFE